MSAVGFVVALSTDDDGDSLVSEIAWGTFLAAGVLFFVLVLALGIAELSARRRSS